MVFSVTVIYCYHHDDDDDYVFLVFVANATYDSQLFVNTLHVGFLLYFVFLYICYPFFPVRSDAVWCGSGSRNEN